MENILGSVIAFLALPGLIVLTFWLMRRSDKLKRERKPTPFGKLFGYNDNDPKDPNNRRMF